MARQPKPLSEARANLEASIPSIPGRYEQGIMRGDWVTGAASESSEANFAQAMQRAIQSKSRQAGVRRAGNESWQQGSINKGAPIIGQRIQDALSKWEQNFERPYSAVIRQLTQLPPRTLDANQNIDRRLKPIVATWQANKVRGGAR